MVFIFKYGELINNIRDQKNLSVEYLIKNILSKSQYYKFVSNKSEISIVKFNKLLNRLSITYNEFFYLYDVTYENKTLNMADIRDFFEQNNIKALTNFRSEFFLKYKENENIKDYHFYLICSVLIKRMQKNEDTKEELSKIKQYLLTVDDWTHYEISLLNNTMFIFDYKTLNILIKILMKKTTKNNAYQKEADDIIKIVSNIMIMKITENEIEDISYLVNYIEGYVTTNIESKIIIFFWKKLHLYINNTKDNNLFDIKELIEWLDLLDVQHLSNMFKNILDNIQV